MAKHILIPCKICQQEQGAEQAPHRKIREGVMIREDETEVEFRLVLACGHVVEFDFAQSEKEDVIERLQEADTEMAAEAADRAAATRAAALRRQALDQTGSEDPAYVHHYSGDIEKAQPSD